TAPPAAAISERRERAAPSRHRAIALAPLLNSNPIPEFRTKYVECRECSRAVRPAAIVCRENGAQAAAPNAAIIPGARTFVILNEVKDLVSSVCVARDPSLRSVE
ncbi:MAG TPA: hypothetical protein VFB06_03635, partial [Streptosporangiaceae bacterium]|nr:hypothetical protein [Streptosporangiaceae bacterium]